MWKSGGFIGTFGDPYLEDTELDGGSVAPSVQLLAGVVQRLADHGQGSSGIVPIPEDLRPTLQRVHDVLQAAHATANAVVKARDDASGLMDLVVSLRTAVAALKPLSALLIPGGWRHQQGGHAMFHIVERPAADTDCVNFVTANTGTGLQYHEADVTAYPKIKYRTCLVLPRVPLARVADDAFLLMLLQQLTTAKDDNRCEVIYEVLLPHLAGTTLWTATRDAASAGTPAQPPFATPQRSGTCYVRSLLCAFKYLAQAFGASQQQVKLLMTAVRLELLHAAARDLDAIPAATLQAWECRVLAMACAQCARSSIKAARRGYITEPTFANAVQLIESVKSRLTASAGDILAASPQLVLPIEPPVVQLSRGSQMWAWHHGDVDTSRLVQLPRVEAPELLVDLLVPTDLDLRTVGGVLVLLKWTVDRCDRLSARAAHSPAFLSMYHICTLIHHVVLSLLPIPTAEASTCVWASVSDRDSQQAILRALYQLGLHYAAASYAVQFHVELEAAIIITMSCILAAFDATVRTVAGSPLSTVLRTGWFACPRTMSNMTIHDRTSTSLIVDPAVCAARAAVGAYWDHVEASCGTRFMELPEKFMFSITNPLFRFVAILLEELHIDSQLPAPTVEQAAHDQRLITPSEVSQMEFLARWFAGNWEQCPEFRFLRDLVLLQKVMAMPFSQFRSVPLRLWTPMSAIPEYRFHVGRSTADVAALDFSVFGGWLDVGYSVIWAPASSKLTSPASIMHLSSELEDGASESQVLHVEQLNMFDGLLNVETAELLASYLTAPFIRVPLVLSLFARDGMAPSLLSPVLQRLFEAVLFEPLEGPTRLSGTSLDDFIMVPVSDAHRLGSPRGVLWRALVHDAAAVVDPLLAIARTCEGLCTGPYFDSFVKLFAFAVRQVCRIHEYLCALTDYPPAGLNGVQLKRSRDDIEAFCVQVAYPRLAALADAAVAAQEIVPSVVLHAHAAIAAGVAGAARIPLHKWFCHTAFVTSWHVPAFGAGMRIGDLIHVTFADLVRDEDGQPSQVPLDILMRQLCKCRADWVADVQRLESADRVTALSAVAASASLQPTTAESDVQWESVAMLPHCVDAFETKHPYDSHCTVMHTLSFPGAPFIRVSFDPQCSIGPDDVLTIFAADSTQQYAPAPSQAVCTLVGGADFAWPGHSGAPPLLVPSNTAVVQFVARQRPPGSSTGWGISLRAEAPVSWAALEAVLPAIPPSTAHPRLVAATALALVHNKIGAAVNLIQTSEPAFLSPRLRLHRGAFADSHPDSKAMVNLQLAEVYTNGHMLMPLPAQIAQHATVAAAFKDPKLVLCSPESSSAQCRAYRAQYPGDSHAYTISAWDAIDPEHLTAVTDDQAPSENSCFGLPVQVDGGHVLFQGQVHDTRISLKSLPVDHWVASILAHDRVLGSAVLWHKGPFDASLASGITTLVAWYEAQDSARSGWFCLELYHSRKYAQLFRLQEHGRRVYPMLVFGTDSRICCAGLPILCAQRVPKLNAITCNATANLASHQSLDPLNNRTGSVVICRKSAGAHQLVSEFIESVFLAGLLPAAISTTHRFWRLLGASPTSLSHIIGEPLITTDEPYRLEIILSSHPTRCVVHKVWSGPSADRPTMTLLDPLMARAGSYLAKLTDWLIRLDSLSHILIWSDATARPDDDCYVSLVELPRIGLSFVPVLQADGTAQLECVERAGYRVPHDIALVSPLVASLPHGVILQDAAQQQLAILSTVPLHRPSIDDSPLSSFLVRVPHSGWVDAVKSRHYAYPIHCTQQVLSPPSIGAAWYMIMLRLLMRQYLDAADLIAACTPDVKFSAEELFLLSEVFVSTKEDKHPDSSGLRLKLFAAALRSREQAVYTQDTPEAAQRQQELIRKQQQRHEAARAGGTAAVTADELDLDTVLGTVEVGTHYGSYLEKLAHVSAACRLNLGEEMAVIRYLVSGASFAYRPAALSPALRNRIMVLFVQHSTDDAVIQCVAPVRTLFLEGEHPYAAGRHAAPVQLAGVNGLDVVFDTSTEMLNPGDYLQVGKSNSEWLEPPMPAPAQGSAAQAAAGVVEHKEEAPPVVRNWWGEPRYTGSVFGGNWAGANPNPYLGPRQKLRVGADSFDLRVHAADQSLGGWGWRMFVTGTGGIDASAIRAGTAPIQFASPSQLNGGLALLFPIHLAQTSLAKLDIHAKPWKRTLTYVRPGTADTVHEGCARVLERFFGDQIIGGPRKLGFGLLYEMIRGDVTLKLRNCDETDDGGRSATLRLARFMLEVMYLRYCNYGKQVRMFCDGLLPWLLLYPMVIAAQCGLLHPAALPKLQDVCGMPAASPASDSSEVVVNIKMDGDAGKRFLATLQSVVVPILSAISVPSGLPAGVHVTGLLALPWTNVQLPPTDTGLDALDAYTTVSCSASNVAACVKTLSQPQLVGPDALFGVTSVAECVEDAVVGHAVQVSRFLESVPALRDAIAGIPFRTNHAELSTFVGRDVLNQMQADIDGVNSMPVATEAVLACLNDDKLQSFQSSEWDACGPTLCRAFDVLRHLALVLQLEAADLRLRLQRAAQVVHDLANNSGSPMLKAQQIAGWRPLLSLSHLINMFMATDFLQEVRRLNPLITVEQADRLQAAVAATLFAATNRAHVQRCLAAVNGVLDKLTAVANALTVQEVQRYEPGSPSVVSIVAQAAWGACQAEPVVMPHTAAAYAGCAKAVISLLGDDHADEALWVCEAASFLEDDACDLAVDEHMMQYIRSLVARGCCWEGRRIGHLRPAHASNIPWSALVRQADLAGRRAADLLATKRSYLTLSAEGTRVTLDGRLLVFEALCGFVLHRRQVTLVAEMLDTVKSARSVVHQMLMGAGKTTVIGPLLALCLADSQRLVTMVVPSALLPMARDILRARYSTLVPKTIFTLAFERSSAAAHNIEEAVILRERLLSARKDRAIVCTTPESVKCVLLKYVDLMQQAHESGEGTDGPLFRHAQTLGCILQLWSNKEGGVALLDEVDLLLHPLRSELNFPIGPKQGLDLGPTRWELPLRLLDAVLQAGQAVASGTVAAELAPLADALTRGISALAISLQPHLVLLREDFYHAQLKPLLAVGSCRILFSQPIFAQQGLPSASSAAYQHLLAYLCGAHATSVHGQAVSSLYTDGAVQQLNLMREWLNVFLPHCLSKVHRVGYGLLHSTGTSEKPGPLSRRYLAVPFIGKDVPSPSSEFAHPEVVIGLTFLAYRYDGLRAVDLTELVSTLQQTFRSEPGPVTYRPSAVMFRNWAGRADVLPLAQIQPSDPAHMELLAARYSKSPAAVHHFVCHHVFPRVLRSQAVKLTASGVDLGGDMLFGSRVGFSGTPSNLLPMELGRCAFEPSSTARMLAVLSSPATVLQLRLPQAWTVQSLLDTVARASPGFSALIDAGAMITGFTNQQVAEYLLKAGLRDMRGCVFIDESDRQMIITRRSDGTLERPRPLNQSGLPVYARFTFYDHVHTTGTDVDQSVHAVAAVTLSKDMTLRDYAQACWRMRQVGRGQTVQVLVSEEVAALVQSVASTGSMPCDIMAWLTVNEARAYRLAGMQLCHQQLENVWRKKALAMLQASEPALQCAAAFRQPIDWSIPATISAPVAFAEALQAKARAVAPGIELMGSELHDVEAVLAIGSDMCPPQEPSSCHLDSEMMLDSEARTNATGSQMQLEEEAEFDILPRRVSRTESIGSFGVDLNATHEQEAEQEREQALEVVRQEDTGADRHLTVTPWNVLDLAAGVAVMQPLSALQPVLSWSPRLLVSSNHTPSLSLRRLCNVVVVAYAHDRLHVLCLAEAQSIFVAQQLMTEASASLSPATAAAFVGITLLTAPGGTALGSRKAEELVLPQEWQAVRMLNSDVWYSVPEVRALLELLHSAKPEDRGSCFENVAAKRRRTHDKWQGTMLELVVRIPAAGQLPELIEAAKRLIGKVGMLRTEAEVSRRFMSASPQWVTASEIAALAADVDTSLLCNLDATRPAGIAVSLLTTLFAAADRDLEPMHVVNAADVAISVSKEAECTPRAGQPSPVSPTVRFVEWRAGSTVAFGQPPVAPGMLDKATSPNEVGQIVALTPGQFTLHEGCHVEAGHHKSSPMLTLQGVAVSSGRWWFGVRIDRGQLLRVGWTAPSMVNSAADSVFELWCDGAAPSDREFLVCVCMEDKAASVWRHGEALFHAELPADCPAAIPVLQVPAQSRVSIFLQSDVDSVFESLQTFIVATRTERAKALAIQKFGAVDKLRSIGVSTALEIHDDQWRVSRTGHPATRSLPFGSCVLSGCLRQRGRWFYEVTIVSAGNGRIGWTDATFGMNRNQRAGFVGVGDDFHGWGFNGHTATAWHDVKATVHQQPVPFGRVWREGDVVGCLVDIHQRNIQYWLNGSALGPAFVDCNFEGGIMPAMSLGPRCTFDVNFGHAAFKFPPSDVLFAKLL